MLDYSLHIISFQLKLHFSVKVKLIMPNDIFFYVILKIIKHMELIH